MSILPSPSCLPGHRSWPYPQTSAQPSRGTSDRSTDCLALHPASILPCFGRLAAMIYGVKDSAHEDGEKYGDRNVFHVDPHKTGRARPLTQDCRSRGRKCYPTARRCTRARASSYEAAGKPCCTLFQTTAIRCCWPRFGRSGSPNPYRDNSRSMASWIS